ncbi:MAG: hypothetical protein IT423_05205 [Pirellulaceae bacterium]|nr:hypothetical protein [Pirellulaceae bacterium]
MFLTERHITPLIQMVVGAQPDPIGCDDCFGRVAEYAEFQLANLEIPEALQAIENHLRQCPCCRDEYKALLEGLRAL